MVHAVVQLFLKLVRGGDLCALTTLHVDAGSLVLLDFEGWWVLGVLRMERKGKEGHKRQHERQGVDQVEFQRLSPSMGVGENATATAKLLYLLQQVDQPVSVQLVHRHCDSEVLRGGVNLDKPENLLHRAWRNT